MGLSLIRITATLPDAPQRRLSALLLVPACIVGILAGYSWEAAVLPACVLTGAAFVLEVVISPLLRGMSTGWYRSQFFEHSPSLFYRLSPDGSIQDVNARALERLGFERSELIGRPMLSLYDSTSKGVLGPDGEGLMESGEVAIPEVELVLVANDGTEIPVLQSSGYAIEPDGHTMSTLLIQHDLTEQLRLGRLKEEFVSTINHELRTPLTSIYGSLRLLDKGLVGELPPKGAKLVGVACTNVERLIRLVNNLLDLRAAKDGHLPLKILPVNAQALLNKSAAELQGLSQQSGVTLDVVADPAIGDVLCDQDRITQVLDNLVGNAIKFGAQTVTLSCTNGQKGWVEFAVDDDGPGVEAGEQEAIFEPFRQLEGSNTRTQGGSGLGLSISRLLVEAHGGAMWVESDGIEGSSFRFTLPSVGTEKSSDSM